MSQKDYSFAIAAHLLHKAEHIRGLAAALHTNQTTISRKVYELYDKNVVDYRNQGRNKVFFLKKTIEAKEFVYHVEIEKLLTTLQKYPQLRRIVEYIKKQKKIQLALLFGSYSKEIAHEESDIDIYVMTKDRKIKESLGNLDSRIRVKIGPYDKQNLLIQEIERNHVIIKGIEEYYENCRFFEEAG